MGRPRHLQAYQPLGDLRLVVEGHEQPTDYRRELDLDRAVVRVRYRIGSTTFTREVFSSAPDHVDRRPSDRRRPGEAPPPRHPGQQATVCRTSAAASRPAHDRALARRPDEARRPSQALPRPPGPLVRRRARVRGPDRGRGTRRPSGGRREGTARRRRRVGDGTPGRGHEFQGTKPRGRLRGCAPCPEAVWRAARAARGGLPLALPARPPGSRVDGTGRVAHGRAPRGRARRSRRPGARRDLFPVRALPADRQLASGHPAREPPGHLERRAEPGLGEQVHDQHQHRDELLAGRGDEPRGVPRAALRPDRGAARAGPTDGAGPLRGARLRRAPQHRPLACDDPRRRRPLGPLADGRRVALDAPLGALRLRRGSGVPAQGLPRHEGGRGVLARLPGRGRAGPARHGPFALAGERLPRREGQRGRALRGRDDGLRDRPRALRQLHPRRARSSARMRSSANASSGRSTGCRRIRSASTGSSRSGWRTSTRPSPATATSRTSSRCTRATRSRCAARRSWRRRRATRSSAGWRTAAAVRAGAAPGSSTSWRGWATATRRSRT